MTIVFNGFKKTILNLTKERAKQGIPPLPLNTQQVSDLCSIIRSNEYNYSDKKFIQDQFINRITPGVDETSYLKANLLNDICNDNVKSNMFSKKKAIDILGTMQGGYNV